MANLQLPISRVVDVTIDRQTIFPTRRGFGTLLIVISDTSGPLDADTRTKIYSSINEVASDYASTTEPYKAAQAAFAVSPAPLFIKMGWRDTANPIADELSLIDLADDDWYGVAFTKEVRTDSSAAANATAANGIAQWVEARTKVCMIANNDETETLNPADSTNMSAVLHAAGYDRTGTFYHEDADLYPDVAFLARGLRTNFDGIDSTITMKFKRLQGIPTSPLSTAQVTAATGFVPGQGLLDNAGHFANVYVNVAGRDMVENGNMASGEFFDIIHGVDWLQNAIATNIFSTLASTNKVPYTDQGIQLLVDQVDFALTQAVNNGLLASVFNDETDMYEPEYQITVNRVSNVPISQRAQRIAPTIQFTARLAGAVHYAIVNGTVHP